jgi:probable rRNA maturation factor
MRSRVKVWNLHRSFRLNEKLIAKLAAKVLKTVKKENAAELEIVFMNDAAIKKLNRKYKGENAPTDVLSFGLDRREFGKRAFLGEIFISLDTARRNSKVFGTGLCDEAVLYVIHGILHLAGYDDRTAAQRTRMSKKQEGILRRLCVHETLSKVLTRR